MAKVCKQTELSIRTGEKRDGVEDVFRLVADSGINIFAYCYYSGPREPVILLVTNNPSDAQSALQQAGYACEAKPVILVSDVDRVGAAAELGVRLSQAGIAILYSYASAVEHNQFFAVFKTDDDDRAMQVLGALT